MVMLTKLIVIELHTQINNYLGAEKKNKTCIFKKIEMNINNIT